jgi:D-alanyl-D-alanine dipeptidase
MHPDRKERAVKRLFVFPLLAVLMLLFPATTRGLQEGFVNIEEAVPGIVVELRYFTRDNFVGEPIDGYEADACYITVQAAEALALVQKDLAAFGLGLKIFDAYRPQRAVDHFVRWAEDLDDTRMKAKYYPNVAKENLFRNGYIAAKSGHSRGSTVDLTIVSLGGGTTEELDMGTGWDFFGPKSWPTSTDVTPQQRANRMLLQSLMARHGFRPLAEEWWHFTLLDEPYPETWFDFVIR